jgi:N-acetylglucosaminyldiphosphoundecaprenol N-acetyl-beta-D-mannosaminyltransferase
MSFYEITTNNGGEMRDRVLLMGLEIDPVTEADVVAHVRRALDRGAGGRIVTPNVDILRQATRDAAVRADLADADLVVADGAPLVWAARLAGTPVPERVAGADLIWSLSGGLAQDGRSIYLLGGEPETEIHREPATEIRREPQIEIRREGAHRAAIELSRRYPGLRIAGHASPRYGFDAIPAELDAVCAELVEAKPDLVFVGLGFPRQERIIARLRPELPGAWFLGCGAAINFVAGDVRRAPEALQKSGLEWLHRLATEPRRLAKRYLRHDAPFAGRLLTTCAMRRITSGKRAY